MFDKLHRNALAQEDIKDVRYAKDTTQVERMGNKARGNSGGEDLPRVERLLIVPGYVLGRPSSFVGRGYCWL